MEMNPGFQLMAQMMQQHQQQMTQIMQLFRATTLGSSSQIPGQQVVQHPQVTQGQLGQQKPSEPPRPASPRCVPRQSVPSQPTPPRSIAQADGRHSNEGAGNQREYGTRSKRERHAPGSHHDLPDPDNGRVGHREYSASNAMSVGKRIGYAQNKYSGTPNENLHDFIEQYKSVCKDLQLPEPEVRPFLYNLFKDEALRCYHTNVSRQDRNYDHAVKLMMDQFNSLTKQQNVKNELQALTFAGFVRKAVGNRLLAITSLCAHIESRLPLCPDMWRFETNKVDFLRSAIVSQDWACAVLSRVNMETKFRKLLSELEAVLQIQEEAEQRNDDGTQSISSKTNGMKHEIFFTAPRYEKKIATTVFPDNEKGVICWNCGKRRKGQ